MKQSSHKLLHVTVLVTGWRTWGKLQKKHPNCRPRIKYRTHWI